MADYTIDNNDVIYNSDTFYAFRDVKIEETTPKLLDKQESFQQHYVLIKNNIANETNNFNQQLNIKLQPYTLETKGIFAFNPSIHQTEFDKSRFVLNTMISPQNSSLVSLMNVFKSFDGYFESKEFRNEFFKTFIKENAEISFDYHKLVGQTKIKSLPNAIKMKLRFNKQITIPNITTNIIIKDIKSRKTKEYKYLSLAKLERILIKHTLIQPIITLKLVYFNVNTEIDKFNKEKINIMYGVSVDISKLIIFTDKFDKTIFYKIGDYYDNTNLMSIANNKLLIIMFIFYIITFISFIIKKKFK